MKRDVSFTTREELEWVGAFGLPVHLLARARTRVRLVSLLGMGGFAVFLAYGFARNMAEPGFLRQNAFNFVGDGAAFLISAFLYIVSGVKAIREVLFLNIALGASVAVCAIISIVAPWYYAVNTNTLPHVTWVAPIIILVPLILPIPPRRAFVATLSSGLTVPLGLLVLQTAGIVHPQPSSYVLLCISPAVAVVISGLAAKEIYGINRKLAAARRLAGYTLERKIGEGGMGTVWLATHRLLSRPAAIKLIRKDTLDGVPEKERDTVIARFEREARGTAGLESAHTINLYDFGVSDNGKLYYAMEYLRGMDLDSLVARSGWIPPERAVYLLLQACESLGEAHQHGLIHRDIKPSNLFLCRYSRKLDFLKVLDFGIAKAVGPSAAETGLTGSSKILGSSNFMAPEQVTGAGSEDARTDIYSLGCVAYWLLTGELVFEDVPARTMEHHLHSTPVPPTERVPGISIPSRLQDLVLSCLEKDPDRRPQSMDALGEALAAVPLERTWTQAEAAACWTDG